MNEWGWIAVSWGSGDVVWGAALIIRHWLRVKFDREVLRRLLEREDTDG